jgi:hypothetical protein
LSLGRLKSLTELKKVCSGGWGREVYKNKIDLSTKVGQDSPPI